MTKANVLAVMFVKEPVRFGSRVAKALATHRSPQESSLNYDLGHGDFVRVHCCGVGARVFSLESQKSSKAIPLWHNYLMPVLFVISALSTGLSVASLLAHRLEKGPLQEGRICQTRRGLVGLEILVLFVMFLSVVLGFGGKVAMDSVRMMLTGQLAGYFWILLVGAGLVVPFFLFARKTLHLRQEAAAVGDVGSERAARSIPLTTKGLEIQERAILFCDGAVVLGGLALRALIIFAALPVWNGIQR